MVTVQLGENCDCSVEAGSSKVTTAAVDNFDSIRIAIDFIDQNCFAHYFETINYWLNFSYSYSMLVSYSSYSDPFTRIGSDSSFARIRILMTADYSLCFEA